MLTFLSTGLGMYVIGALFNSQGDTRTTFKINLINIAISIPLAFILIPTHGVPGLIMSILASQLISTSYGLYQIHRMYNINIEWSSSLKILAASISSALLVYIFLKLVPLTKPVYSLTFGGTLYLTSFLAFAPILGAVNKEDLNNLEGLTYELPLVYRIVRYILRVEKKILDLITYTSNLTREKNNSLTTEERKCGSQ